MRRRGFTLVEVVLAIVIMGIVFNMVYTVFAFGTSTFKTGKNKGFIQHDRRMASEFIKTELKTAKTITAKKPTNGLYYSLKFNSVGDLAKTEHIGNNSATELITIKGPIDSVKFIHNDTVGVIGVELKYTEGNRTGTYEIEFKLENFETLAEQFNTNTIYYTKHEE